MTEKERLYTHWLSFHAGTTYSNKQDLLKQGLTPEEIFHMSKEQIASCIPKKYIEKFEASRDFEKTKREIDWVERNQGWNVYWTQPEYPKRLKEIYHYPLGLFGMGKMPKEDSLTIAMVGARDATPYGKEASEYFAEKLASAGVQIVSGLARGIDGYSHNAALRSGYTLGVLGCGIDIEYPRSNGYLYEQMREKGGIISEFPIGTQPMPANFPQRNRVISGISHGVFVIEARERSGSLITADYALEQGRDVFALAGRFYDEMSIGAMELIQKGAKLVYKPENILEEYSIYHQNTLKFGKEDKISLAKNEKLVYDCLRLEPKHVNKISTETNLPISDVLSILMIMEWKGYVMEAGRHCYRIKKGRGV